MNPRRLDDIILPARKAAALSSLMQGKREGEGRHQKTRDPNHSPSRRKGMWILWGTIFSTILLLIFAFSYVFEKATFSITPVSASIELDAKFTAASSPAKEDTIPLTIRSFEEIKSTTVPATETTQVERRASGTIVIYNNYSKESQRLIKNTRFETPEGLIFRIRESVVIPGQKTVSGSLVPGSLEVVVYADEPGERYNIGLTDFTIPGFKGTPRYAKFYARSKTEMAGGFIGNIKTIPEHELQKIHEELEQALKESLGQSALGEAGDSFIFYPDGALYSFEPDTKMLEETTDASHTITISLAGKLTALFFSKKEFEQMLVKRAAHIPEGSDVYVSNWRELQFTLLKKETLVPTDIKTIEFALRGAPKLIWNIDAESIKKTYAGTPKAEVEQLLTDFPSIARIEVTVRPFWKKNFPENPEDIEINIEPVQ